MIIITLLIILGTAYDINLRYKVLRKEDQIANHNVISNIQGNKKWSHAVTVSRLWSVETHNGSLGKYCNYNKTMFIEKNYSVQLFHYSYGKIV